jgi:hypothetical protein
MIHNMRELFLTALAWLWAFNSDPVIKLLAVVASLATIASAISTIIKNRRK